MYTKGNNEKKFNAEFLRPNEVAEILRVHIDTVRLLCEQGRLHYIRTPGRHRRILRDSLEAFMAPSCQMLPNIYMIAKILENC